MNAVGYEVGVDAADLIGVGLIEKGELMLEMLLSRLELNLRSKGGARNTRSSQTINLNTQYVQKPNNRSMRFCGIMKLTSFEAYFNKNSLKKYHNFKEKVE